MNIQTQNFGEITLINFTELSEDDLRYVLKMRNHPEIKKWMYNQKDITEQQHFSFVDDLKRDTTKHYFLVKKSSDTIGSINFTHIDNPSKTAKFGLYANPFQQISGAGRMLEEVSIVYARQQLKLEFLNLEVFEENKKVINLHKKYGFTQVGMKTITNQPVLCMQKKISESE